MPITIPVTPFSLPTIALPTISIDSFAAGDGVTDDTPALQQAFAALPRGGTIILGAKKYLFDVGFTVPQNVYLVGVTNSPVSTFPLATGNFDGFGTVIYLNPASNRVWGLGSGLQNCMVLRKGLTYPTTPAQGDALIASFAGTALLLGGDDIIFDRLFIGGFNRAIDWLTPTTGGGDRHWISNIVHDCLNGIRICRVGDVGHIFNLKSFPFLTADDALLDGGPNQFRMHKRSGVALEFFANSSGNSDYVYVSHTNFFGWTNAILVGDGNNNLLLDDCTCDWPSADNAVNPTPAIGIRMVTPTNNTNMTIDRFRCSGQAVGIKLEGNASDYDVRITNGVFFTNARHIYAPSGCTAEGVIANNTFQNLIATGGAVVPIELQDDVQKWTVVGNLFVGPFPGSVYTVHDNVVANGFFAESANTYETCVSNMGNGTLIASGNLSGTAVTITNIPPTYSCLILEIVGASSGATEQTEVQFSTNNGSTYDTTAAHYPGYFRTGTTFTAKTLASALESATRTAAQADSSTLMITGYGVFQGGANVGPNKITHARISVAGVEYTCDGTYLATSAINALKILGSAGGTFDAGTYSLYGIA